MDWGELRHAYGPATHTPGHLRALEFGDAAAREAALYHLDVAVLHGNFPETATAPAVRVVTGLLAEGRAHPDTVESLVEFLGAAALAVTDLDGIDYRPADIPDLAEAVAASYPVVLPLLTAPPVDRIAYRAIMITAIARLPSLADRRAELVALLRDCARRDPGPRESWVFCLGRLGVDLRDRLDDPDPGVRLRAALFHEDDPRARDLIRSALSGPIPPGIDPGDVVAAAIRTAAGFDEIAGPACDLVRRDSWVACDSSWGALVAFGFPEASGETIRDGSGLTDAQRALAGALAANGDREIWNSKNGNCSLVFARAGLPHDREACRRLSEGQSITS
ncbi:hypothetical protein [Actinoplanes sp. G11-F43]|uniref:hypothetical protein n=1 Tax=Actinoplanes sp. G11-F43 TaxID=3424130 RepID=UPI003D351416